MPSASSGARARRRLRGTCAGALPRHVVRPATAPELLSCAYSWLPVAFTSGCARASSGSSYAASTYGRSCAGASAVARAGRGRERAHRRGVQRRDGRRDEHADLGVQQAVLGRAARDVHTRRACAPPARERRLARACACRPSARGAGTERARRTLVKVLVRLLGRQRAARGLGAPDGCCEHRRRRRWTVNGPGYEFPPFHILRIRVLHPMHNGLSN
jgi:hypothetical protein